MAKRKKLKVAGNLVSVAIYPAQSPMDSAGVRAGKRLLSSEAQQRMNLKYAYKKLEFEIAANFRPNDLYITLTYDDAHLPDGRKRAIACIRAFLRKLRAARLLSGGTLKYIYVTESKHGDGRIHHHILINTTGNDYDLINRLWIYGHAHFKQIRVDKEKHYGTLAGYLCKEQRDTVGQRLWSCSRNLDKAEEESFLVDDDTSIVAPPGALVLEDSGDHVTEYGHFRYIKYLAPGYDCQTKQRAKRRRRKVT